MRLALGEPGEGRGARGREDRALLLVAEHALPSGRGAGCGDEHLDRLGLREHWRRRPRRGPRRRSRVGVGRRRPRRRCGRRTSALNVVDRRRERVAVGQRAGRRGSGPEVGVAGAEVVEQLGLEAPDVVDGDVVEVAVGAGEDRHDLLLDRHRRVAAPASAARRGGRRARAAPSTPRRARNRTWRTPRARGTARGRASAFPTTDFIALICAAPPTRDTEMPTSTAGRTPDLKRSSDR